MLLDLLFVCTMFNMYLLCFVLTRSHLGSLIHICCDSESICYLLTLGLCCSLLSLDAVGAVFTRRSSALCDSITSPQHDPKG